MESVEEEDVMSNQEDPRATETVMMRSVARTLVIGGAEAGNAMEEALGTIAVEVV